MVITVMKQKVWEAMCHKFNRKAKTIRKKNSMAEEQLGAYTMEEINARIDHSLAGKSSTHEEVMKKMEQKFPWLYE